jgi:hypothetical protein
MFTVPHSFQTHAQSSINDEIILGQSVDGRSAGHRRWLVAVSGPDGGGRCGGGGVAEEVEEEPRWGQMTRGRKKKRKKNLCNRTINQHVYSSSQFSNSGPIIN